MSWPQYGRHECSIDDRRTELSNLDAELLCALLLSNPDHWTPVGDIIESIWPNADLEPDWAASEVGKYAWRLRRLGVEVEGRTGRDGGYHIPRHARGRPERIRLAA